MPKTTGESETNFRGGSSSSNSSSSSSNKVTSSSSNYTNNPGRIIMPPAPVLWVWLSYMFETTGQWLLPPGGVKLEGVGEREAARSASSLSPAYSKIPFSQLPKSELELEGEELPPLSRPGEVLAYQNPFPTMLPYAPAAPELTHPTQKAKTAHVTTGYHYAASAYFVEAERLIEQASLRPISEPLLFGCKLVLALVLAWCHFPLFGQMSGRRGNWVALGYDKCARELKLKSKSLGVYLSELQRAGLLQAGCVATQTISRQEFERLKYDLNYLASAEGGVENEALGGGLLGFWLNKTVQERSNIYRISSRLEVSSELPIFNPFTEPSFRNRSSPGRTKRQSGEGEAHAGTYTRKGLHQTSSLWDMNTNVGLGKDVAGLEREVERLEQGLTRPSQVELELQTEWEEREIELEGLNTDDQLPSKPFPVAPCINNHDDVDDEKKDFSIPVLKILTGAGTATRPAEATHQSEPVPLPQSYPPQIQFQPQTLRDSYPTPSLSSGSPHSRFSLDKGQGQAPLPYAQTQTSTAAETELEQRIKFLKPPQRAIFDFLSREARFEGHKPPLMDYWEAYKLALIPRLSLELVKERYAQALEVWQTGYIRKTPIGLLHRALQKDYDPRSGGSAEELAQLLEDQAARRAEYEQVPPPSEELAEPSPLGVTAESKGKGGAATTSHTRSAPPGQRSSNFGFGGANRPPHSRPKREQGGEQPRQARAKAQKAQGWEAALAQQQAARKQAEAEAEAAEQEEAEARAEEDLPLLPPVDPQIVWQRLLAGELGGPLAVLSHPQRKLLEGTQLQLDEARHRAVFRLRSVFEVQAVEGATRNYIRAALRQQKLIEADYALEFEVLA